MSSSWRAARPRKLSRSAERRRRKAVAYMPRTISSPGPKSHGFCGQRGFQEAQVEHWSLTTLREKLIKIGAKVACRARYITFQLGPGRNPEKPVRRHPALDRRPAASTFTAMMARQPVASRSPDRKGLRCPGQGAPSTREKATSRAFDRKIGPTKNGDIC